MSGVRLELPQQRRPLAVPADRERQPPERGRQVVHLPPLPEPGVGHDRAQRQPVVALVDEQVLARRAAARRWRRVVAGRSRSTSTSAGRARIGRGRGRGGASGGADVGRAAAGSPTASSRSAIGGRARPTGRVRRPVPSLDGGTSTAIGVDRGDGASRVASAARSAQRGRQRRPGAPIAVEPARAAPRSGSRAGRGRRRPRSAVVEQQEAGAGGDRLAQAAVGHLDAGAAAAVGRPARRHLLRPPAARRGRSRAPRRRATTAIRSVAVWASGNSSTPCAPPVGARDRRRPHRLGVAGQHDVAGVTRVGRRRQREAPGRARQAHTAVAVDRERRTRRAPSRVRPRRPSCGSHRQRRARPAPCCRSAPRRRAGPRRAGRARRRRATPRRRSGCAPASPPPGWRRPAAGGPPPPGRAGASGPRRRSTSRATSPRRRRATRPAGSTCARSVRSRGCRRCVQVSKGPVGSTAWIRTTGGSGTAGARAPSISCPACRASRRGRRAAPSRPR